MWNLLPACAGNNELQLDGCNSNQDNAGNNFLNKGTQKLLNGVANSSESTINRAYQYWDRGAMLIYQYANRAGVNGGFGSAVGTILNSVFS